MNKELKIGIFAVSVIIVAFFVLNYLRGEDIFDREIDVVAYCDDVNGLVASAPVYVKGYKAGQVSSVEYDGDNACFEIVCSVMKEFNLSSDSITLIKGSIFAQTTTTFQIFRHLIFTPNR